MRWTRKIAWAGLTLGLALGSGGMADAQVATDPTAQTLAAQIDPLPYFRCFKLADLNPAKHRPMSDFWQTGAYCVDMPTRIETFASAEDQAGYEAARQNFICTHGGTSDRYVRGNGWVVTPQPNTLSANLVPGIGGTVVTTAC